jgi:hypothetical protein
MPGWASIVLCGLFLLLDEHVKGDVYGFGVKDVEITKVAKKARITKVAKKAGITEVAEMADIPKRVQGIQMTTRHVIWPVTKKAEVFIKTARHAM